MVREAEDSGPSVSLYPPFPFLGVTKKKLSSFYSQRITCIAQESEARNRNTSIRSQIILEFWNIWSLNLSFFGLAGDKEFNRIGTLIKCASNLFYFKTSHLVHFAYLALWIIPTRLTLKVLGLSPGNINFLFVIFFLFFFFKFQFKLFFIGFAEFVQSKCTCANV